MRTSQRGTERDYSAGKDTFHGFPPQTIINNIMHTKSESKGFGLKSGHRRSRDLANSQSCRFSR